MIGNPTAMMFAKRADMLLKSKRPAAAIKDCDAALELNPDSAKALRVRGVAHRKLHNWNEARRDLSEAQKIDYDDGAEDAKVFVTKKWQAYEKVRGGV